MKDFLKFEDIKEAIYIVDMNNGFCEKGNLACPNIKEIVPNIKKLIKNVYDNNGGIFFVNDKHTKESIELLRYPKHCTTGYENAIINEFTEEMSWAKSFYEKNSTCAMFAPLLMFDLEIMEKLEKVYITGCCTDICIINFAIPLRNFFDEHNRKIDIIIPQNCVSTFEAEGHNKETVSKISFDIMRNNGIDCPEEI